MLLFFYSIYICMVVSRTKELIDLYQRTSGTDLWSSQYEVFLSLSTSLFLSCPEAFWLYLCNYLCRKCKSTGEYWKRKIEIFGCRSGESDIVKKFFFLFSFLLICESLNLWLIIIFFVLAKLLIVRGWVNV